MGRAGDGAGGDDGGEDDGGGDGDGDGEGGANAAKLLIPANILICQSRHGHLRDGGKVCVA